MRTGRRGGGRRRRKEGFPPGSCTGCLMTPLEVKRGEEGTMGWGQEERGGGGKEGEEEGRRKRRETPTLKPTQCRCPQALPSANRTAYMYVLYV